MSNFLEAERISAGVLRLHPNASGDSEVSHLKFQI